MVDISVTYPEKIEEKREKKEPASTFILAILTVRSTVPYEASLILQVALTCLFLGQSQARPTEDTNSIRVM